MEKTRGKQSLCFPRDNTKCISMDQSINHKYKSMTVTTSDLAGQAGLQQVCLTEKAGMLRPTNEISNFPFSKLLINSVMVQYQVLLGGR